MHLKTLRRSFRSFSVNLSVHKFCQLRVIHIVYIAMKKRTQRNHLCTSIYMPDCPSPFKFQWPHSTYIIHQSYNAFKRSCVIRAKQEGSHHYSGKQKYTGSAKRSEPQFFLNYFPSKTALTTIVTPLERGRAGKSFKKKKFSKSVLTPF